MDEQLINETVKRMIDSGIEDDTIVSTLTDIGISENEAKNIIEKNKSVPETVSQNTIEDNTPSPEMNSKIENLQNQIHAQNQINQMNIDSTDNAINLHSQKLDEAIKKVDNVKNAVSTELNQNINVSLKFRLDEMDKKMGEINAGVNANLELMKKILETNRAILTDLEMKK
ncbi:MAG: hypothetical protein PHQ98_03290 [Candidatus ainarchaeum sp.]|nr:hypothetical protein [Candidatus ainarchaeum sp.]